MTKTLSQLESWVQTAKPFEKIVYHEGYLAKDRFANMELKKISSMFLRLASHKNVVIYQKKLAHGLTNKDPVFQYIAQKI